MIIPKIFFLSYMLMSALGYTVDYGCNSVDVKTIVPKQLKVNEPVEDLMWFRDDSMTEMGKRLKDELKKANAFLTREDPVGKKYLSDQKWGQHIEKMNKYEKKFNLPTGNIRGRVAKKENEVKINKEISDSLIKNMKLVKEIGTKIYGKCSNPFCSDRDPNLRFSSKTNFANSVHRDLDVASEWKVRLTSWFDNLNIREESIKDHEEKYKYFNIWVCIKNCNDNPLALIKPSSISENDKCSDGKGGLNFNENHEWYYAPNMEIGDSLIFPGIFNGYHAALRNDDFFRYSFETRCVCGQ